jgi:protein-tyrosine phosphatase
MSERRPGHHRILFVCSGNICRSPMAERLAEALGDRIGLDVEAASAGTLGLVDRPADAHAIAVLREVGLDLRDHRSQGVSEGLVAWADAIAVMELKHAAWLLERFPDLPHSRVVQLGPYAGSADIPDPVGRWRWHFRRVRRQLETALERWLRELA